MQGKIKLNDNQSLDIISCFNVKVGANEKTFILTTLNEIDQNGLIKILASEVIDNKILKIESQDEWTIVKNVMRSIISSSSGEFVYSNLDGQELTVDSDDVNNISRVIAIQEVAKEQLVKDYNEKKTSLQEEVQKENNEEVKVEELNNSIYPEDNKNLTDENALNVQEDSGNELIPGIQELTQMESDEGQKDDVPLVEENVIETPVESIEPKNEEVVSESVISEPVVKEEEAIKIEEPKIIEDSKIEESVIDTPIDINVNANVNQEEPVVSVNKDAKEILVNKIVEAIDEYIKTLNLGNSTNDVSSLKSSIAKMEEQLKTMNEALKS